jgi:hypothetical protein
MASTTARRPVKNNFARPEQSAVNRKGVVVSFTMSHELLTLLNALATASGCSRSQYVRKLVLSSASEFTVEQLEGLTPDTLVPKDLDSYEV